MHELLLFFFFFLYCSTLIVAFHEACSLGFADVVQTFLECTGDSDDLIAKKGLNALQIATMNKRSLVVQILLKRFE